MDPSPFPDISKVLTAVDVQGNAQESIESQQIKNFFNFVWQADEKGLESSS